MLTLTIPQPLLNLGLTLLGIALSINFVSAGFNHLESNRGQRWNTPIQQNNEY